MKPLSLTLRRCVTFDDFTFDLPDGLVALLGTNGAGKSTIVNALDTALFGPESRTLADLYPRVGGDEPLMIELTFEHHGDTYRVRRSFSPKGRGASKTDLEQWATPGGYATESIEGPVAWRPLTVESQTATQETLEQIVGLTRDTFRASSFLAQNEAGVFCEAAPRKRKAILADALGLSEWDEWLTKARTEKRRVEGELDRISGQLEQATGEVAERSLIEQERRDAAEQETAARASLETTAAALATARERLAEARGKVERRAAAQEAVQRAEAEVARIRGSRVAVEQELESLSTAEKRREQLHGFVADLPALEQERQDLSDALAQWNERRRLEQELRTLDGQILDYAARAGVLRANADKVLAPDAQEHCDRCRQVLHADAAERAAESYRDEADTLDGLAEHAMSAAAELRANLLKLPSEAPDGIRFDALPDLIRQRQGAREEIARLDAQIARRETLERQLEEMRAELPDRERGAAAAQEVLDGLGPHDPSEIAGIERALHKGEFTAEALRSLLSGCERNVARCDERLSRIDKIQQQAQELTDRSVTLHAELDLHTQMERACGPNGVPALILETVAIPQIETEATRILGELGGPAYAVELHTQREKKSGGLADTLDIVLLTDAGARPYESFSGGEKARVAFALRLALAQLLAGRKGSETGLLVIDEIDGLDAEGIAALVRVLEQLQQRIRTIIVVSHDAQLRDAFENTIELENVDGRSRIVGTDREEVPV